MQNGQECFGLSRKSTPARSEVYATGVTGYGSTDTKVLQFTSISVTGTAFTIVSNNVNGTQIRILEDGIYSCTLVLAGPTNTGWDAALTRNASLADRSNTPLSQSTLTTRLVALRALPVASSTTVLAVPWTGFLRSNDLFCPQGDGTNFVTNGALASFYLVKVAG